MVSQCDLSFCFVRSLIYCSLTNSYSSTSLVDIDHELNLGVTTTTHCFQLNRDQLCYQLPPMTILSTVTQTVLPMIVGQRREQLVPGADMTNNRRPEVSTSGTVRSELVAGEPQHRCV